LFDVHVSGDYHAPHTGTLGLFLHVRLLVDAARYVLAVLTPGRHLEAPHPVPHHKTNAPD
jgi:hypothetical protein